MPRTDPRPAPSLRPTWAEIDVDAFLRNLALVRRVVGPATHIFPVLKANAYGHDATALAKAAEQEKQVPLVAVTLVEEGLKLREGGIKLPILVLGGVYEGAYEVIADHDLVPIIYRPEHILGLSRVAKGAGRKLKAHLKVDTGMIRLGALPDELPALLQQLLEHPEVQLDGFMSHFSSADVEGAQVTQSQIQGFKAAYARLLEKGFAPRYRHLAHSAGLLSVPEARDGTQLNAVRPGLMLYGAQPSPWLPHVGELCPVMAWKTRIVHLKHIPAGVSVSYCGTWTSRRDSRIAVLPVGYADGYNRLYSNRAQVLVRGFRAPVVGRVCMDMCMVDVTEVPAAQVGDEVVLLGSQGKEHISAEELAKLSETIPYEVLCAVGPRVPRRIVNARPTSRESSP